METPLFLFFIATMSLLAARLIYGDGLKTGEDSARLANESFVAAVNASLECLSPSEIHAAMLRNPKNRIMAILAASQAKHEQLASKAAGDARAREAEFAQ